MVDRRSSSRRNMEPPVNLCVNCKGESQSFLVSDSEKTTWADVEAMVLVSFDLGDIQIKYIDEENEEVSVNSQDEYEEALKIAVKQGGILQMIVYENHQSQPTWSLKASESGSTTPVWTGKRSLEQCTLVPRSAEPEMQIEEASTMASSQLCNRSPEASSLFQSSDCRVLEVITDQQFCIAHENGKNRPVSQDNVEKTRAQAGWIIRNKEQNSAIADVGPSPVPPDWFIRYMDHFKEQIIHETVLKVTEIMKDRVSQSPDWMSDSSSSSAAEPEQTSSEGSLFDWLMACSNCKKRLLGIRYQCSTCPSFSICEPCETGGCDHDPNHLFLKMRRPLEPSAEELRPPLPFSMDNVKLQKQMHKTFLKAEKQRLRAEKKQRRAEMKELEKQLKLHRRFHRWHSLDSPNPATETSQISPLVIPMEPCTQFIPTLSAVFVDENLPDGTHLQPGTRFIKHWRMSNTGNVKWNMDTKLKFMWGNLTLASSSRKDAPVPSLLPGQIGVLSVEFVAPALEGTYTSHWRLAHKGEQFGPRVWCSISVDSLPCSDNLDDLEKEMSSIKISSQKDQEEEEYSAPQITGCPDKESLNTASSLLRSTHDDREMYIPSVDLLTAQDLLSFELLDINIVQELDRVPHNTPVDMTPCMSPLPHDGPLMEKPGLGQIKEEIDGAVKKCKEDAEETEGDISGTQFVCETVIRSLTLDAAPDYNPPQKKSSPHSSQLSSPQLSFSYSKKSDDDIPQKYFSVACREQPQDSTSTDTQNLKNTKYSVMADVKPDNFNDVEQQISEENPRDEVESQASTDSSEEYIIILPECFDTSKPLGDSMYCSALSESQGDKENYVAPPGDEKACEESVSIQAHTINDILTTSQTLDTVPLTPEVVTPSPHLRSPQYVPAVFSVVEDVRLEQLVVSNPEPANNTVPYEAAARPQEDFSAPRVCFDQTRPMTRGSIAGGLMKGALSVAASAYRALFVGQQETPVPPCSEDQAEAMMAILIEMGFCNRQLNQRLLQKHNCNLMDVVTELIQINDNDWYSARY